MERRRKQWRKSKNEGVCVGVKKEENRRGRLKTKKKKKRLLEKER